MLFPLYVFSPHMGVDPTLVGSCVGSIYFLLYIIVPYFQRHYILYINKPNQAKIQGNPKGHD